MAFVGGSFQINNSLQTFTPETLGENEPKLNLGGSTATVRFGAVGGVDPGFDFPLVGREVCNWHPLAVYTAYIPGIYCRAYRVIYSLPVPTKRTRILSG